MDFLPVFFSLRAQPCLVVGGGSVAARKIGLLRRAGGQVRVVAPELAPEVERLAQAGDIQHIARGFEEADLDGVRLVIAATNDRSVNARVSEAARARGLPVNVVDDPALCSFIVPSILDRSPVMVAVSTGGASPVLARQLRTRLESLIPAAYGRLASLLESCREQAKARIPDERLRRRFWEQVVEGPVAELMLAGQEARARQALEEALQTAEREGRPVGEVYLVGAGPGDELANTQMIVPLIRSNAATVSSCQRRLIGDAPSQDEYRKP